MAKASQLPSGAWRVKVYAGKDSNGKHIYKSFSAPTKREAEYEALIWQKHYKGILSDKANMTVYEAIEAHIQSKSNILSPATIAGYKRIQANRMGNLMNIPIKLLTNDMIQAQVNLEAKKYSAKTINNSFLLLKTILAKYRPDFLWTVKLPVVYPTVNEIPLDDDLRKIYAVAYGTEMEIPFLLACWLGLRVSEIRGLKMENIKEDRIVIKEAIVDDMNGQPITKKTKTRTSTRILELPVYIKTRIEALITDDREYVTSLSGQAIYKRFVRICERAGVGPFRFHDLRHTNASIMLEENVPDKYIAERGGWGSEIYKSRYQHTTINKTRSVNEKIDSRFERIFAQETE